MVIKSQCPTCKTEYVYGPDSKFCPKDGTKLPEPETHHIVYAVNTLAQWAPGNPDTPYNPTPVIVRQPSLKERLKKYW